MNKKQINILEVIYDNPDIQQTDLIQSIGIDEPIFRSNFDILKDQKLVAERIIRFGKNNRPEGTDKWRLSPNGEEIVEKYRYELSQNKKADIRFAINLVLQIITLITASIPAWNIMLPWIQSLFG